MVISRDMVRDSQIRVGARDISKMIHVCHPGNLKVVENLEKYLPSAINLSIMFFLQKKPLLSMPIRCTKIAKRRHSTTTQFGQNT